jgi:hypothetical protein
VLWLLSIGMGLAGGLVAILTTPAPPEQIRVTPLPRAQPRTTAAPAQPAVGRETDRALVPDRPSKPASEQPYTAPVPAAPAPARPPPSTSQPLARARAQVRAPTQRRHHATSASDAAAEPPETTTSASPSAADAKVQARSLEHGSDTAQQAQPRAQPQAQPRSQPRATLAASAARFSPGAVKLRVSSLSVRGSLPSSVVRRGVERIRPRLLACYRNAATRAGRHAFGTLEVSLEIDEHGRARSPRAEGAELPGLAACVREAALRIAARHAPDTGTVAASFRVELSP